MEACIDPESFVGTHDYLVCVDSDGCVFDNMGLKHMLCFFPAFVEHFRLQAIYDIARDTWEFVNLASETRGINRFKALLIALQLLDGRPEILGSGIQIPLLPGLSEWVKHETQLCAHTLELANARLHDPDIDRVLAWSKDVDRRVERIVRGKVPPFINARRAIATLAAKADILVVSQGPLETVALDWTANNLDAFPRLIIGQESGKKCECIRLAAGTRYHKDRILMIGDAPGDLEAAEKNGSLFFPILPGNEENSWAELHDEGLPRFFSGKFGGDYHDNQVRKFKASLSRHS